MSHNVLTAISNLVAFGNNDLKSYASTYLIRINAVGEQLEFYMKDALANTFKLPINKKEEIYDGVFSHFGTQNHPPDMIVKNSDAFEVKKIENPNSTLHLNSSPPKNKLRVSDTRITDKCRNCDGASWKEKDLFYAIGHTKEKKIKYLFLIHGECYAADHEFYDRIHSPIKKNVNEVLDSLGLEKGKGVELGKVKRADPLGITELKIRGMWQIQNPLKVYKEHCKIVDKTKFHLFALMRKEKYDSFPKEDIKLLESNSKLTVKDIRIKDPSNPAKLVNAKLIIHIQK